MIVHEIDNNGIALMDVEEEPEIIDIGIKTMNGSTMKRG
jgi:hypothetical protein